MNKNRANISSAKDGINGFFISVVAILLALLLTVSVITVVFMPKNDSNKEVRTTTPSTNKIDPSTPVINNTTPLYPTRETKTSYKISTSSSVTTLVGDDFIKSNNTPTIKSATQFAML